MAVCGGGGGSANNDSNTSKTAGSGGTSSVKSGATVLIQATGGTGGFARGTEDGGNRGRAGEGGLPNGSSGKTGQISLDDTMGFGLNFVQNSGSYGAGGGCRGSYASISSGGSGGYDSNYKNVNSNEILTISVGKGGQAYDHYSNGYARNGVSGFVLIAYGEGIE